MRLIPAGDVEVGDVLEITVKRDVVEEAVVADRRIHVFAVDDSTRDRVLIVFAAEDANPVVLHPDTLVTVRNR